MLFFLFRKSYIFWFFLFSKKFIISNEKSRKTNNLNSENKLFLTKNQKNKHHLIHIDIYLGLHHDLASSSTIVMVNYTECILGG